MSVSCDHGAVWHGGLAAAEDLACCQVWVADVVAEVEEDVQAEMQVALLVVWAAAVMQVQVVVVLVELSTVVVAVVVHRCCLVLVALWCCLAYLMVSMECSG